MRDRIAYRLCNLILNTIATPWYRDCLDKLIRESLKASAAPSGQEKP